MCCLCLLYVWLSVVDDAVVVFGVGVDVVVVVVVVVVVCVVLNVVVDSAYWLWICVL